MSYGLYHLICRLNVVKARKRYCVCYSGVVRVKRYNVRYAHIDKLVKHQRRVERFASAAPVLPSLVKHRHNNRYAPSLSAHCRDNTLQVLIMVVRAHVVFYAVHFIRYAVVKHIADNINVVASYGVVNNAFTLARAEARTMHVSNVCFRIFKRTPFLEVFIDLRRKFLTALHAYDSKLSHNGIFLGVSGFCHNYSSFGYVPRSARR